MKKTAVILVNWNSYALTRDCILSLQQIPAEQLDILLVDNNSADGSGRELEQAFPDIIYLQAAENLGFTGGNNLAINYALQKDYTYVLLLNNDTTVAPDFLEKLTCYLDEHPKVGAVQPLIYCEEPSRVIWNAGSYYIDFIGQPLVKKKLRKENPAIESGIQVDWITGCAFLLRTDVLKKTGNLSDNMFMYFEDVDLSFRIRKLGYELHLVPAAEIWHVGGMSNKQTKKNAEGYVNPVVHYLNTRNRIWILKKYTPLYFLPTALIYHLLYFSGILLYFMLRLRWKKLFAVARAVRDGLTDNISYSTTPINLS
jgi:GT2 family glycosyltransferase